MTRIKTIIVDDERPARQRLQRLLEAYSTIDVIAEAGDGVEAQQKIIELKPNLVFMDIEMPYLNGIEVARSLGAVKPMIIFTTAFDAYAVRAFEVNAVDYVLKPIQSTRLAAALDKILSSSLHAPYPFEKYILSEESFIKNRRISFVEGKEIIVLFMHDIALIKSEDRYAQVFYGDKSLLVDESLTSIAARLDKSMFLFAHRNVLLNINYVDRLKRYGLRKYALVMKHDQEEVLVSRGCLPHVREALAKLHVQVTP